MYQLVGAGVWDTSDQFQSPSNVALSCWTVAGSEMRRPTSRFLFNDFQERFSEPTKAIC